MTAIPSNEFPPFRISEISAREGLGKPDIDSQKVSDLRRERNDYIMKIANFFMGSPLVL
jgi:hypothetical protein